MTIAIIGAGIAGLACAEHLRATGHPVVLFDKGRGAGGRTATRRVNVGVGVASGDISFDHGAQYFNVRDPALAAAVDIWAGDGVVARWPAAGAEAWVGTPGMNAMVKTLAAPLDVHWNSRVDTIRRADGHWFLDPVSDTPFAAVIVALPAEQAGPLLAPHEAGMASLAQACPSAPCWTVMVAFGERVAIADDIVRNAGAIGWAARNSAKPGRRSDVEAWVIQASADWSRRHLDDPDASIVDALLAAFADHATQPLPALIFRSSHRWRYARVQATTRGALWNPQLQIGAAGDWLLGPRIESAWMSGRLLAELVGGRCADRTAGGRPARL